jgi:hypothetical protein
LVKELLQVFIGGEGGEVHGEIQIGFLDTLDDDV